MHFRLYSAFDTVLQNYCVKAESAFSFYNFFHAPFAPQTTCAYFVYF